MYLYVSGKKKGTTSCRIVEVQTAAFSLYAADMSITTFYDISVTMLATSTTTITFTPFVTFTSTSTSNVAFATCRVVRSRTTLIAVLLAALLCVPLIIHSEVNF